MQIRALTAENGLDLHGFHETAQDGHPDDELFSRFRTEGVEISQSLINNHICSFLLRKKCRAEHKNRSSDG